MSKRNNLNYIITSALIAAAYASLTFLSGVFGLAFGPIQLRLSEVLTIFPVFTPAAIPGLTVGCFISNIGSFNAIDMVFGTLATLAAAFLTYYLRNLKVKGIPFLALLPPVVINAVVIGFEIAVFFMPDTSFIWAFLISAAQIGISQFIVCFVFGIPFYLAFNKYNIFEKLGNKK
ncbi:MAG: QueT transporter family protein [Ruminococcaceae bacterium]|nr:QueT transporter family protein [Oscillospiraceae bacterium]